MFFIKKLCHSKAKPKNLKNIKRSFAYAQDDIFLQSGVGNAHPQFYAFNFQFYIYTKSRRDNPDG